MMSMAGEKKVRPKERQQNESVMRREKQSDLEEKGHKRGVVSPNAEATTGQRPTRTAVRKQEQRKTGRPETSRAAAADEASAHIRVAAG
jgi:hypothetical protein